MSRWFETTDERRWVGALSIAAAAHLGLLVGLFLVVLDGDRAESRTTLDSSWTSPAEIDLRPVYERPVEETTPVARDVSAAGVTGTAVDVATAVVALPKPFARGRTPVLGTHARAELLADAPARSFGLDGLTGGGLGDAEGDGQGFFGIGSPGRTFVYVVDASSSMLAPHDSDARTRFGRVRVEIVNSIAAMTPEQGFFVIFFNAAAHPMPASTIQPGVLDTKQLYLEWVARHQPGGETQPLKALELAIALQPDVVYFLTDGVLQGGHGLLGRITRMNAGRTRIDTFAFGSRRGERMLRRIADHNGGRYKFVP